MWGLAWGADDMVPRGKEIFESTCADCHRANGEGLPATYPALNQNPFVLGEPTPLIATILNGRKGNLGRMPGWKNKLDDRQIAAVVTYLRQAWSNRAPAITPAMVSATRSK